MGHRSHIIIKDGDHFDLYYDHWAANVLDKYLVLGPDFFFDYIRKLQKDNPIQWMDDRWCEGAVLVDKLKKKILWFGGEDTPYELVVRVGINSLIRFVWSGWDVEWAAGGITQMRVYLGEDKEALLAQGTEGYVENGSYLVSKKQGSKVSIVRLDELPRNWLLSLEEFEALDEASFVNHFDVDQCIDDFRKSKDSRRISFSLLIMAGGVHVDVDSKTVSYWWAQPFVGAMEDYQKSWPGWQLYWLGADAEKHFELAEGALVWSKLSVRKAELLRLVDFFIKHYAKKKNKPPDVISLLVQSNIDVKVNPDVFKTVDNDASIEDRAEASLLRTRERILAEFPDDVTTLP